MFHQVLVTVMTSIRNRNVYVLFMSITILRDIVSVLLLTELLLDGGELHQKYLGSKMKKHS